MEWMEALLLPRLLPLLLIGIIMEELLTIIHWLGFVGWIDNMDGDGLGVAGF